jgi:hypothetical protein
MTSGDASRGVDVAWAAEKWRDGDDAALARTTPRILLGYLLNTVLYLALSRGLHFLLPSNVYASSRYCDANDDAEHESSSPSSSPCARHDLLAFQIVSFLNLSYLGLNGVHAFFVSRRPMRALPRTPTGRILQRGCLPEADVINSAIVVFQGWDFVMSCAFVEHRAIVMLVHHALAFVCGYFSLVYEVRGLSYGWGLVALHFLGVLFFRWSIFLLRRESCNVKERSWDGTWIAINTHTRVWGSYYACDDRGTENMDVIWAVKMHS